MNDNSNVAWRKRINFNTFAAIIFIVLWTVVFFIIPYQIQKPMLFMGPHVNGLKADPISAPGNADTYRFEHLVFNHQFGY